MTKQDLETFGIIHLESKLHPRRFMIENYGEFDLNEPYNMEDVFRLIYQEGLRYGIVMGKNKKIEEIKNALDLF